MDKLAFKTVVLAAFAFFSLQSLAGGGGGGGGGGIVFDPTNFGKNTITAAKSIAMEARQASMQATQLQQYIVQLKQQASLGNNSMMGQFNDVMNTYRTVQQYQAALAGLQGSVGDVQGAMNNRMNQMAASGLSWDQYIKREREMLKYRQDNNSILTAHERQVMDNAAQRYSQVRELQPQIMTTEGTHQSMQTMNTQMNMLTASMQDLITLSAAEGNRKSIETTDRQAIEQRKLQGSEESRNNYLQTKGQSWNMTEELMRSK